MFSSENIDSSVIYSQFMQSGVPATNHSHRTNRKYDSNGPACFNNERLHNNNLNMRYLSKGLHFCNLNIQHIIPKLDELRIVMATENCPNILGLCETFLNPIISNNQVRIEGYDFL